MKAESRLRCLSVLEFRHGYRYGEGMSIQQIEEAIKGLPTDEIETLRAWLEEYLEDEREVTPEFAASIERGRRDIAKGHTRIG
jgi:hypothetical protein